MMLPVRDHKLHSALKSRVNLVVFYYGVGLIGFDYIIIEKCDDIVHFNDNGSKYAVRKFPTNKLPRQGINDEIPLR